MKSLRLTLHLAFQVTTDYLLNAGRELNAKRIPLLTFYGMKTNMPRVLQDIERD
jgi:hypothetical protein